MTTLAVILAGGLGSRLTEAVSCVPKSLAPIADQPFIFILLRQLAAIGLKKVCLLLGHKGDAIISACQDGRQFGLSIDYFSEGDCLLGTAGALKNAESLLSQHSEFLLLNGDTYYQGDWSGLLNEALQDKLAVISATQVNHAGRFGSIVFDQNTAELLSLAEKTRQDKQWVNAGIYKLSTTILDHISSNQASSLERDVLPRLLAKGLPLSVYPLTGCLHDIGIPEDYAFFTLNYLLSRYPVGLFGRILLFSFITKRRINIFSGQLKEELCFLLQQLPVQLNVHWLESAKLTQEQICHIEQTTQQELCVHCARFTENTTRQDLVARMPDIGKICQRLEKIDNFLNRIKTDKLQHELFAHYDTTISSPD